MNWQPLSELDLIGLINDAEQRMSIPQQRLWEAIRIEPMKWQQSPYGDEGGGFWAVAVLGKSVVWYNDIEDGFNRSEFKEWGILGEYWCNQDQLEWTIQDLLNLIQEGYSNRGKFGPPQPM